MSRYWNTLRNRIFYGWWIVILGSLIMAVGQGILYHGFTVFFLPLKRDLAVSAAAISLLYGASRLEGGIEGPIVGPLIDRFGPRTLIIGGATLAGVGFILLSMVHSFTAFFVVYVFVISLGYNAGFYHPVSTAINSWFIKHRSTGFAVITATGSFGGMVLAPLLSNIILNLGWRTGAVIAGIIILAIAIPAAIPMHRSPEVKGLHPDGKSPQVKNSDISTLTKVEDMEVHYPIKQALKTWKYWLLTISITLRLSVTIALTVHFVPILVWKGIGEARAAYLVSLSALSMILATLIWGWMGDRWNKPLLCAIGILPVIATMAGLIMSQAPAVLYMFPVGLAITTATAPLNWSLIGDLFGRRSYATLRGIMGLAYGTGTFISPIFAGWVLDHTGSYHIALVTFSIILLISALAFTTIRRPSPQKNEVIFSKSIKGK